MELLRTVNASMVALALAGTASGAASGTVSSTTRFVDVGVPGRVNQTPMTAAAGSFVAVVWSASAADGATDIYAAISRDSGRAFGTAVRVNTVDGDARVNGEQAPQVAIASRAGRPPAITVVWTSKGPNGTTLMQSRSDDGGRSFGHSAVVPGSDATGNRGWQATAVETGGRVDALWLDHRELAADSTMAMSHHEHGASADTKPDGIAMAQKSKLYVASVDGSLQPHAITGGVCYCCKTALVAGADGALYAAWRHVYPGNFRDMAFTVSRDGGRTFAPPLRVSEDKWMLEGCPDDGPAMAVDGQNRVHLAWPTLVTGSDGEPGIGIFYATSGDTRRFSARIRVPTEGVPHHPRIVVDGSRVILVWDESKDGARRIVMAERTVDSFKSQVISNGTPGVYPAMAAVADGVVAVWTSGRASASMIRVAHVP